MQGLRSAALPSLCFLVREPLTPTLGGSLDKQPYRKLTTLQRIFEKGVIYLTCYFLRAYACCPLFKYPLRSPTHRMCYDCVVIVLQSCSFFKMLIILLIIIISPSQLYSQVYLFLWLTQ